MLQEVLIKIILKKLDECWVEISLTPFCGIVASGKGGLGEIKSRLKRTRVLGEGTEIVI